MRGIRKLVAVLFVVAALVASPACADDSSGTGGNEGGPTGGVGNEGGFAPTKSAAP